MASISKSGCLPMVQETGVQSPVKSYQRLKKWNLMPPCLILSIIIYVSRVKWSNQGKRVAPSPTPRCSCYWKGRLRVALDYGRPTYYGIKDSGLLAKSLKWYHIADRLQSIREENSVLSESYPYFMLYVRIAYLAIVDNRLTRCPRALHSRFLAEK